jgi:hypothetical protein
VALRGEAIAVDESIVLWEVENAWAGVARLCVGKYHANRVSIRHTHLWFRRDAPNFHPAKSEVEKPWRQRF